MNLILTGVIIIAAFWILALHSENKSKQIRIDRLIRDSDQSDLLYNKLNSNYIELYETYKKMKDDYTDVIDTYKTLKAEVEQTLKNLK